MSSKIYTPYTWTAEDWGLTQFSNHADSKVISVPVFFNQPQSFCYDTSLKDIKLSDYELVVLSDIEYAQISDIKQWIEQNKIKKYLLATGGITVAEEFDDSCMVYRPWWSFNLLKHNTWTDTHSVQKKYLFDALLGARRPHRDYIMLALEHHNLLSKSVITYRDIFTTGHVVDYQSREFAKIYSQCKLRYPWVSPNLLPEWEVQDNLEKSISRLVPWQIYRHTWYTIVAETLGTGNTFFLSEKTTKALYSQRMFVVFSNAFFLHNLQKLGFETFGDIIDESYDSNVLDFDRFRQASDQLVYLSRQNASSIYEKIKPRLLHNYHRLYNLQRETKTAMKNMLQQHVPADYIID